MSSVVLFNCGINGVESIRPQSHDEIMEMECGLLMSNSEDPKVMALVKENIGAVSNGPSSYRGDSMKLGLWKAFDLKKQNVQHPPVHLRCTGCGWYTHTPYSSIGSTICCRSCHDSGRGSQYFECVGCGHVRTHSYASCRGCGKRFA